MCTVTWRLLIVQSEGSRIFDCRTLVSIKFHSRCKHLLCQMKSFIFARCTMETFLFEPLPNKPGFFTAQRGFLIHIIDFGVPNLTPWCSITTKLYAVPTGGLDWQQKFAHQSTNGSEKIWNYLYHSNTNLILVILYCFDKNIIEIIAEFEKYCIPKSRQVARLPMWKIFIKICLKLKLKKIIL